MAVKDLIESEWGIHTAQYTNRLVNECDNTVTKLADGNPDRLALLVINLSANVIHVYFDNTVSSAKGIYLTANGGSFSLNWRDDFILSTLPLYGIAGAANSDVLIIETVIG